MGEGLLAVRGHGVRFSSLPSLSLSRETGGEADEEGRRSRSAYMYRLSLEYARILHHDEGDVDFVEMPDFSV